MLGIKRLWPCNGAASHYDYLAAIFPFSLDGKEGELIIVKGFNEVRGGKRAARSYLLYRRRGVTRREGKGTDGPFKRPTCRFYLGAAL